MLLQEYWGTFSTPNIAEKLNRTTVAVRARTKFLGLGYQVENSEYITLGSLLAEFGVKTDSRSWQINIWLKEGFPVHRQRVDKRTFKMVDLEEFWDFAEKNKHLFDFSKLELNALGKEPEWVKKARETDYQEKTFLLNDSRHWTRKDEKELLRLFNSGYTTVYELSKRMKRTESSIRTRMRLLGIKASGKLERTPWSDRDMEILQSLLREEKPYEYIADVLGKTASAVRSKTRNIYGSESFPKIMQKIKMLQQ